MTDSSPVDNAAAPAETVSDVTSESSTETQGVKSTLDAINVALKGSEAAPASNEQGSKESGSQTDVSDELSEEEKQSLSERAQHRFRELVDARKTVEAERDGVRQELEAVKPKAERFDQLTGFMRENRVTVDHLNNALQLTALVNTGQYDRALPVLRSLLQQVENAAGEVLPPDLQERVRLGYITEADAKAMHKAQTGERRVRDEAERRQRESTEQAQANEFRTMSDNAARSADTWAQEQATSDPDWNLKRDLVMTMMEAELGRRLREQGLKGFPANDKAVREFLTELKGKVDAQVGRFRPKPQAIAHATGGHPSPRSAAKPTSIMDAVNAGLSQAAKA